MITLGVGVLSIRNAGIEVEIPDEQLVDNVPNEEAQKEIYERITGGDKSCLGMDLDGDTVSVSIGTKLLGTMYIHVLNDFYSFERSFTNQ